MVLGENKKEFISEECVIENKHVEVNGEEENGFVCGNIGTELGGHQSH